MTNIEGMSELGPAAANSGTSDDVPNPNRVYLRGRLGATAQLRVLPSGDELCQFRLTVDRPPGERGRVDCLECASLRARVRRTVARAEPGDELEVTGSLRRRFWRGASGPASRYEVSVETARVTARHRPARRRSGA